MKSILASLVVLGLAVVSPAELKKLNGTWKPVSGEMAGKALPKSMLDAMVLILKDGSYDYDEGHGHDIGKLIEVGNKAPLGMDIVGTKGPNKGRTYKTIYQLNGKTLSICYGIGGTRPTAFETKPKTLVMLIKYARAPK